MCVMAVVGAAPCQCFSPGGNQTMSPGRISSIGPPQRCARPQPAVTMSVCPSGWVCHAVRAPGSNVTMAPATRAGSVPLNGESMRTVPVNQSAGPLLEGCEPFRLISIFYFLRGDYLTRGLRRQLSAGTMCCRCEKLRRVSEAAGLNPKTFFPTLARLNVLQLFIEADRK